MPPTDTINIATVPAQRLKDRKGSRAPFAAFGGPGSGPHAGGDAGYESPQHKANKVIAEKLNNPPRQRKLNSKQAKEKEDRSLHDKLAAMPAAEKETLAKEHGIDPSKFHSSYNLSRELISNPQARARLLASPHAERGQSFRRFREGSGKPRLATVRNLEIFATGQHRDKEYDDADLDQMVDNFNRLGPQGKNILQPPAVLGHEEEQEYLERSDLPAAGWPKRIWRKGTTKYGTGKDGKRVVVSPAKLMADLGDMPLSIAKLCNQKAYRKVSAEIYDDFANQGKSYGMALRRIALLGGEVPQVKELADIPQAEFSDSQPGRRWHPHSSRTIVRVYSEPRGRRDPNGSYRIFCCETKPMPTQYADRVKSCMDEYADLFADMDPEMKKNIFPAKLADDADADAAGDAGAGDADQDNMADGDEMDRDAILGQLEEQGMDTGALSDCSDEALQAIADFAGVGGEQMADTIDDGRKLLKKQSGDAQMADASDKTDNGLAGNDYSDDDEAVGDGRDAKGHGFDSPEEARAGFARMGKHADDEETVAPGPRIPPAPKKVVKTVHYSEKREKMQKTITEAVKAAVKSEMNAVRKEHQEIKKYSETQVEAVKKLAVSEFVESRCKAGKILPAEKELLIDQLMRADASSVVRKFKEGTKEVSLTELDEQKRVIDARPILLTYAERCKSAKSGEAAQDDNEVQEVENHFELYSEQYKKINPQLDKKKFVEGFTQAREQKPGLTAKEHLNVR